MPGWQQPAASFRTVMAHLARARRESRARSSRTRAQISIILQQSDRIERLEEKTKGGGETNTATSLRLPPSPPSPPFSPILPPSPPFLPPSPPSHAARCCAGDIYIATWFLPPSGLGRRVLLFTWRGGPRAGHLRYILIFSILKWYFLHFLSS